MLCPIKVIAGTTDHSLPFLRQNLYAITMKGFGLGGKEILHPLQFIFVGGLFSQVVAQGLEQIIVGGSKVWAVRWVDEHFKAQLKQRLRGDVCCLWPDAVVPKADGSVVRDFALNLTCQSVQLLATQMVSDAGVGCQQFKQPHTLTIPPD